MRRHLSPLWFALLCGCGRTGLLDDTPAPKKESPGLLIAYATETPKQPARVRVSRVWPSGESSEQVGLDAGPDFEWSLRGRWLAVADNRVEGATVTVWSPDGTELGLDLPDRAESMHWAPTEDAIAIVTGGVPSQGVPATMLAADLRGESIVTSRVDQSAASGQFCAFSRDGSLGVYDEPSELSEMQVARFARETLGMPVIERTGSGVDVALCSVSPDHRWVAVFDALRVHLISMEGPAHEGIDAAQATSCSPEAGTWAPSHALLAFASARIVGGDCALCEGCLTSETRDIQVLDLRGSSVPAPMTIATGDSGVWARALGWGVTDSGDARLLVVGPGPNEMPRLRVVEIHDGSADFAWFDPPAGERLVTAAISENGEHVVYHLHAGSGGQLFVASAGEWQARAIGPVLVADTSTSTCRWSPDQAHLVCEVGLEHELETGTRTDRELWSFTFAGNSPRFVRLVAAEAAARFGSAEFSHGGEMLAYLEEHLSEGRGLIRLLPFDQSGPLLDRRFSLEPATGRIERFAWQPTAE